MSESSGDLALRLRSHVSPATNAETDLLLVEAASHIEALQAKLKTAELMAEVYRGNVGKLGGCGKCGGLHSPGPCQPPVPSGPPPHKMMG